jgi:hypothetical protein
MRSAGCREPESRRLAQTFLQLVLLAVIMVGQRVQSAASDARAEKQFDATETILDALSLKTEGGLKTLLDAIEERRALSAGGDSA